MRDVVGHQCRRQRQRVPGDEQIHRADGFASRFQGMTNFAIALGTSRGVEFITNKRHENFSDRSHFLFIIARMVRTVFQFCHRDRRQAKVIVVRLLPAAMRGDFARQPEALPLALISWRGQLQPAHHVNEGVGVQQVDHFQRRFSSGG